MNPHILYIHIVYLVFVSAFVVLHSWRLRDFKLRINARLLSRSALYTGKIALALDVVYIPRR